mmetsp:Transcript_7513/g.21443  ORF Transcript_7513/g.21443 Transcript_7513/m.21443 type:complete len:216 (-) Transcript_7513:498-1145(-)
MVWCVALTTLRILPHLVLALLDDPRRIRALAVYDAIPLAVFSIPQIGPAVPAKRIVAVVVLGTRWRFFAQALFADLALAIAGFARDAVAIGAVDPRVHAGTCLALSIGAQGVLGLPAEGYVKHLVAPAFRLRASGLRQLGAPLEAMLDEGGRAASLAAGIATAQQAHRRFHAERVQVLRNRAACFRVPRRHEASDPVSLIVQWGAIERRVAADRS